MGVEHLRTHQEDSSGVVLVVGLSDEHDRVPILQVDDRLLPVACSARAGEGDSCGLQVSTSSQGERSPVTQSVSQSPLP